MTGSEILAYFLQCYSEFFAYIFLPFFSSILLDWVLSFNLLCFPFLCRSLILETIFFICHCIHLHIWKLKKFTMAEHHKLCYCLHINFVAQNNFGHLVMSFLLPLYKTPSTNLGFSMIYFGINAFMIFILLTSMLYWYPIFISHSCFLDWKIHESKNIYSVHYCFLHFHYQGQLLTWYQPPQKNFWVVIKYFSWL